MLESPHANDLHLFIVHTNDIADDKTAGLVLEINAQRFTVD